MAITVPSAGKMKTTGTEITMAIAATNTVTGTDSRTEDAPLSAIAIITAKVVNLPSFSTRAVSSSETDWFSQALRTGLDT